MESEAHLGADLWRHDCCLMKRLLGYEMKEFVMASEGRCMKAGARGCLSEQSREGSASGNRGLRGRSNGCQQPRVRRGQLTGHTHTTV